MKQNLNANSKQSASKLNPTLGVCMGPASEYDFTVLAGITDIAQRYNFNLINFENMIVQQKQETILYQLSGVKHLSGLIILAATLSIYTSIEKISQFFEQYKPLPMVSVGIRLPNIPSVFIDNSKGLNDLIAHFITDHHYKHIAFIKGPENSPEAVLRYQTYCSALAHHGIKFNSDLVLSGDFFFTGGQNAIKTLLKRNLKFDAVIAANDEMALGAMEELQTSGYDVPQDVAVGGFDNIKESQYAFPALTTVKQSIYNLGYQSALMLGNLLKQNIPPPQVTLPTTLVIRQSCGCVSDQVKQAGITISALTQIDHKMQSSLSFSPELKKEILSTIQNLLPQTAEQNSPFIKPEIIKQVVNTFLTNLTKTNTNLFLLTLTKFLRQQAIRGADIHHWHNLISALGTVLRPYLTNSPMAIKAEILWQQARIVLAEIIEQVNVRRSLQLEQKTATFDKISNQLITVFTLQQLITTLIDVLPQLEIETCYLTLYHTQTPFTEIKPNTEPFTLRLNYSNQKAHPPLPGNQLFPAGLLLPPGLLPIKSPYNLLVMPLNFRNHQFGFIIFGFKPGLLLARIYGSLRNEISSAIHNALTVQQLQITQAQLEIARHKAEAANKAKSKFLANMSHELRTPLNGILGYAQILKQTPTLHPQHKSKMDIIQQSGEHLLMLINDILDLSKIEAGKITLTPVEINLPIFLQSIANVIKMQTMQKDIGFIYHVADTLPKGVLADETRLRQVLLNLVSNAIKFTDIGEITFKVTLVKGLRQTQQIRFEVSDTGVGMTPKQLKKIFLPFEQVGDEQRKLEGTGLGLAISQHLVSLMGGRLEVDSTLNVGSSFWFELKLPTTTLTASSVNTDSKTIIGYKGGRLKALVVDDNPHNRQVIIDLLSPLGFEVIEAENGHQGLEKAQSFYPDLIILDIVMPIMSGLEVIQVIRQLPMLQDVVIIVASASAFEEDKQKSIQMGCNDFIAKPINVPLFLALLKKHLDIEWIYKDLVEDEMGTLRATDETSPALIPPPIADLNALWTLGQQGDLQGIEKYAKKLKQLDKKYIPFATKLYTMAHQFEEDEISELLDFFINQAQQD